jgi:mxaJ protein
MYSVCKPAVLAAIMLASAWALAATPPLRVCADGNNLPFSNTRQQGFENALARMVARDLGREVEFLWLPQQERHIRQAMAALHCDLTMGTIVPSEFMVLTVPYYRSSYVFVSRRDRHLGMSSLGDPRLAKYRIGAHLIGGADTAVPPAQELARRGLVRNIVGYSIFGHPTWDNPSSELITAVERGDVDMAVAWGPMAGYFAKKSPVPLQITPICSRDAGTTVAFDIAMGVRRGDDLLRTEVNQSILRRQKDIDTLLASYGVPLLSLSEAEAGCQ